MDSVVWSREHTETSVHSLHSEHNGYTPSDIGESLRTVVVGANLSQELAF